MQLALNFDAPQPPEVAQVAELARWLYQQGHTWTKAAQICAALPHLDERSVRRLAAASAGLIVSGPGCPGYKHVLNCDPEEVRAVANRLQHQAKLMSTRAGEILSQHHRGGR